MPEAAASAKGTRLEGAQTEAEAARQVRDMFTQIAPRYDLLNHLLSLQLDRLWRARVTRRLQPILNRSDALVLDVCCGTGDLAFSLARSAKARVIGADFSHAMLVRARTKSQVVPSHSGLPPRDPMPLFEADALRLPFADASFDLITTAFGFRNLANYEAGLLEVRRVLKPGGILASLEFTEPPTGPIGALYRWYFHKILPRIGNWLSGDCSAYTYLPASVARFFRPKELADLMATLGYQSIDFQVWTLGTVALHRATKPG